MKTDSPLPILYIVATPIGNLGDLSRRAKEVLEQTGLVFAEDTRQARQLYQALGIRAPKGVERLDAHSTEKEIAQRLEKGLKASADFSSPWVYLTDAGTPGVSDPGARLVRVARQAGVSVLPLPGPSALAAFISACGEESSPVVFHGFFPRKKSKNTLKELSPSSALHVFFESPLRVLKTVEWIAEEAPSAHLVLAKEMTKLHENWFTGRALEVKIKLEAHEKSEGRKGEWVFSVNFSSEKTPAEGASDQKSEDSEWHKALECLLNAGVAPSQAVKEICKSYGASKKGVYARAMQLAGKK